MYSPLLHYQQFPLPHVQLHRLNRLLGVNFINILRMNFLNERCFGSFFYVHVTREKLPKQPSYDKCVLKILIKLTTDQQPVSRCLCSLLQFLLSCIHCYAPIPLCFGKSVGQILWHEKSCQLHHCNDYHSSVHNVCNSTVSHFGNIAWPLLSLYGKVRDILQSDAP